MHSASLDLVLFNMRIAIVIPTCNDSLYVAECLKSISAGAKGYVQSVIVVDAGSKDGTLSVVRSTGLHQNINGTIIEDCSGGRGAQCAGGGADARDHGARREAEEGGVSGVSAVSM